LCKESLGLDDGARFSIRDIMLAWDVPYSAIGRKFVTKLLRLLKRADEEVTFCISLSIYAKYAHPNQLLDFIDNNRKAWETSNFAYRQAIAVMPRLFLIRPDLVQEYLRRAANSGKADVVSVAKNFEELATLKPISKQVKSNFFPPTPHSGTYPLAKFLLLKWLKDNNCLDSAISDTMIKGVLKDRWYLAMLPI
jgi:hypothetical protein